METKPDTIKISASHREELQSTHADLFVTVRGASVIGGGQAMKKAREVSGLIEDLRRAGLPEDKVFLQGMHFAASSGTLLKSSSAVYRLRLRVDALDRVPALLDVIGSQRNTVLESIDWKYPEDEAREQALETALEKAKGRAAKIAAALGVRLLGVYEFMESSYDDEQPMYRAAVMMKVDQSLQEPSLDMDIQHTKTINVSVEVWYRVSELS